MTRIMLDTDVFDRLIEDTETLDRLRALVASNRIAVLSTPIQQEQVQAIADDAKRALIATVPVEVIPTWGWALGVSRLAVRLAQDDAIEAAIGKARRDNPRNLKDALIAASAEGEADALVTCDNRLRNRVARLRQQGTFHVEAWDYERFRAYLKSL